MIVFTHPLHSTHEGQQEQGLQGVLHCTVAALKQNLGQQTHLIIYLFFKLENMMHLPSWLYEDTSIVPLPLNERVSPGLHVGS